MDIYFFSNLLVTLGLFLQLQTPYALNKMTFILLAISTFMMAYAHMKYGSTHKYNMPLKLLNGALLLMIVYRMM